LKLGWGNQGGRVGSSFEESDLEIKERGGFQWEKRGKGINPGDERKKKKGLLFLSLRDQRKVRRAERPSQEVSSGGVGRKQGREREKWEILTL